MKRITIVCLTLLSALHATAAIAKSITCSYPRDQELTFDAPKKLGGLPPIEFDDSSEVTRFSFRDDNVHADQADIAGSYRRHKRKRVRIVSVGYPPLA
jgi:hypothetical protein